MKCFVAQGICVDLNVHRGDARDNGHLEADHKVILPHNPHCHLLYPTRHVTHEGFSKHKAREWESWGNSEFLIQLRKEWADIQNRTFERKGLKVRVSHERSIEREKNHERER